ncbi:cyclodeaminase/cyclohydrolase family protein [Haladaptatus sp. DYF46]|uniref:cyclodeaminase/cyclohydrolase family protein n=1 Tax=Haladaptatus sp. DYF46 TaxID=2886041 RepID=UPI001E33DCD4|nr:cyclodeaminase/cyclohydrolase family protein [Haladaptatus sp. DYF46]
MSYRDQSLGGFLSNIASTEVTPAGGTSAAVIGATGASLCEMVCLHTIGKQEAADVDRELADIRDDLRTQRNQLLDLADTDAEVVDKLIATSEENQSTMKRATGVPLAVAEACLNIIDHGPTVTERGNQNAIPDAGAGVFFAQSALQASIFIVRSNLEQITDQSFVDEVELRTTEIERAAEQSYEQVILNLGRTSDHSPCRS